MRRSPSTLALVFTETVVPMAPTKCLGVRNERSRPGTRHLEGVLARDRVVLVEGGGNGAGGPSDRFEVDAVGALDGDAELRAGELEVIEGEGLVCKQRLYDFAHTLNDAHLTFTSSGRVPPTIQPKAWAGAHASRGPPL